MIVCTIIVLACCLIESGMCFYRNKQIKKIEELLDEDKRSFDEFITYLTKLAAKQKTEEQVDYD